MYMGEAPLPRRVRRVRPITVGVISAALTGLALTLFVKSIWALGVEAGGSCGTSHGISYGPCPRGTAWMFPVSLVSLFVLVPVTFAAALRALPGRLGCLGAVLLVGVGVVPGLTIFNWSHGKTLKTLWQAPPERPATAEALGSWPHGDIVVRARFDGLVGYDVATGATRWAYSVPGTDVLCAMSRATSGGIGLIAHGPESRACGRIAAVDLNTGRALWERDAVVDGISSTADPDTIAVAGDAAIMVTSDGIQAAGLRTGARLWAARDADRCRFRDAAGGSDQVITVVDCVDAVPRIRAIDPATGKTKWETQAPIRGTTANITPLSASPAVLHVRESGVRGTDVIVSFDRTGRAGPSIQVDDGEQRLDTSDHGFDAAPARRLFIQDGMLVAKASTANGKPRVVAYGLSDGRRRWSTNTEDFNAMQVEAGQALAIGDQARNPALWRLSLRDGRMSYVGLTRFPWMTSDMTIYTSGDRYVVVAERATTPKTFPVAVLRAH